MAPKQRPPEVMREVQQAITAWIATHPDATLAEIEAAVEAQVNRLRAGLVADAIAQVPVQDQPLCTACGATMAPRTTTERHLVLQGEEAINLERRYAVCPTCGAGLFPPG